MKKLFVCFLAVAGFAGLVHAGPNGDATAGKSKAATCVACHGEGGNSVVSTFPKLAGQNERYLLKQMKDVQCGALSKAEQKSQRCNGRSILTMTGQLDRFDDADLADIAAYYAAQPVSGSQANADLAAKGEEIYRAGIRVKGVAACTACHSPTGSGNGPAGYPLLGGQHADYVAAQLKAFRAAADGLEGRSNDGETKIMRDNAYRMSDCEIAAVASYISGLH